MRTLAHRLRDLDQVGGLEELFPCAPPEAAEEVGSWGSVGTGPTSWYPATGGRRPV
ncbi:MAG: hypothetical protein ACLQGJ_13190 [Candidatus Dormibacteria bacterium]